MNELLPCPFCGSKPSTETRDWSVTIYCSSRTCGCCVEAEGTGLDCAAEAWNRRHAQGTPDAEDLQKANQILHALLTNRDAEIERLRSATAQRAPMAADIAQIIDAGRRNGKSDLEIAEAILREFDAAQGAPWQSMETAPKDGTPVFLIIAGSVGLPWSDYWDLENEFWTYYHQTQEYLDRQIEPTHWMLIPAVTSEPRS